MAIEQLWHGEVAAWPVGSATTTNMGSGVMPSTDASSNYGYVAYARDLGYYKENCCGEYTYQRFTFAAIDGYITDEACYGLCYWDCSGCSSGWKNYAFFGGPGSEATGCN